MGQRKRVRVSCGSLLEVVWPGDVKLLQSRVRAERDAIGASLRACGDKVPPDAVASWAAYSTAVDTYLADEASFWRSAPQYRHGEDLLRQLDPWREALTRLGCNAPPRATPEPENGLLVGLNSVTKAALVLGGIWLLTQHSKGR